MDSQLTILLILMLCGIFIGFAKTGMNEVPSSMVFTIMMGGLAGFATMIGMYGKPLEYLLKDGVHIGISSADSEWLYEIDETYTTIFLDQHNEHRIMGIYIVDRAIEDQTKTMYGQASDALRQAYELQVFDLTNAVRANFGKTPFLWNDKIPETVRKHSEDMAINHFFDHYNLAKESPFDRIKADGIEFSVAAENLASGQRNAVYAVAGWMNSYGHRQNLLNDAERLGVGVHFGGDMAVYYTRNFYTPPLS
jgi:hypothetical protein